MTEPAKPGILDRFRARYKWFDHVMRAQERYQDSKGDFYAAGITYFTIFALFPLLMVAFSIAGFVLASQPDLLAEVTDKIKSTVSGDLGDQLVELMDSAIESRTSVGIIGLGHGRVGRAGLDGQPAGGAEPDVGPAAPGAHQALSAPSSPICSPSSALFAAIIVTVVLTALGSSGLMKQVVEWLGLQDLPGMSIALRIASIVISILVSWLLFTWMIARLPRESITFRSAARAGLMVAVAFEIFKLVASIYLKSVVTGPAGATFGPVLGLMVFAYITARMILFATAWAATARENLEAAPVDPPAAAQINPRVQVREGIGPAGALTAAAVGALGALGFSRLTRRR